MSISSSLTNSLLGAIVFLTCFSDARGIESPESRAVKFTSHHTGNVFPDNKGELTLIFDKANRVVGGSVLLNDEMGQSVSTLPIAAGSSEIKVVLPHKGFYAINASVHYQDGSVALERATAAVIGVPIAEQLMTASRIGVWHVHGDLDLARIAGSRWNRQMWRIKDYQLDRDGAIIPKPKTQLLDKRFSWIGTFAWGLPQWLEGRPKFSKAIVKGDDLFTPADWAQLDSLVRQFARDVADFPPVFELWNEPELHWAEKFNPEDFVKFHAVLAGAIKSVHPDTKVIGPCFWHIDLPRLKQMVNAGLLNHLDGLSLHGYVAGATPPEGELIERIVELKQYLRSIGKGDFPIYITEFGWTTGSGGSGPRVKVDELTQARYITRSLSLLAAQDLTAVIPFVLLYNPNPLYSESGEVEADAGFSFLYKNKSPKPVYAAYANAAKWLAGTSKPVWLKLSSTTHLVLFDKGVNKIAVAWDAVGEQTVHFPKIAATVEGMVGQGIPAAQSITLSPSPVFFQLTEMFAHSFQVKPPLKVNPGNVLDLDYEIIWVPGELQHQESGQVYIPLNTGKGMYVVFGKRGESVDVIPIVIGK